MSNPLISVIVPTIGRDTLKRSIQSILDSKYPNLEIIIVSDNSKVEKIRKICNSIQDAEYYQFMIGNTSLSPAQAKNIGIQEAKGKYITFLDDDDIAYPEKFFALSEYLEKHLEIFGAFGQYNVLDVNTGKVKNTNCGGNANVCFNTIVKSNYIGSGSIMLRNTKDVRFPENKIFGEDYRLWMNLMGMGHKIDFISKVVYGWTQNTKSGFTSKKEFNNWRELVKQNQEEAIKQWRKK